MPTDSGAAPRMNADPMDFGGGPRFGAIPLVVAPSLQARQAALVASDAALSEAQLGAQKQREELAEVRDLNAKTKAELASVMALLAQDKASHVAARKTLAAVGIKVEAADAAMDQGEGAVAGHAHGDGEGEEADAPPSQELA